LTRRHLQETSVKLTPSRRQRLLLSSTTTEDADASSLSPDYILFRKGERTSLEGILFFKEGTANDNDETTTTATTADDVVLIDFPGSMRTCHPSSASLVLLCILVFHYTVQTVETQPEKLPRANLLAENQQETMTKNNGFSCCVATGTHSTTVFMKDDDTLTLIFVIDDGLQQTADVVGLDILCVEEITSDSFNDGISLSDDSSESSTTWEQRRCEEAYPCTDSDDSRTEEGSYHDLLALARTRGLRKTRRAQRRTSNESFANDSIEIAKMKMARKSMIEGTNEMKIQTIVYMDDPCDGSQNDLLSPSVDVKNGDPVAPDRPWHTILICISNLIFIITHYYFDTEQ
jgi:hypothetical protein